MTELPRSTPAAQGIDAAGIDALLAALTSMPDVEPHSLMVLRHGRVVAERWWWPYRPETPQLVYSLSKSFTSAALGLAVAEGLIDLDAPALSYFPEFDTRVTDAWSRSVLVRHLASMASGHEEDTIEPALRAGMGDMALGMFLLPPTFEPGAVFAYNQPCTYTIAAIIERTSGVTLTEFLRPRLFQPLGIHRYGWSTDPVGRTLGFTGLHVPTEAIAKLGQLHLDGGRWQGKQILPEGWVAEATRAHVATNPAGTTGDSDWDRGYGFQFWRSRHGYRGDGALGQFMVVLPEADAVVALTSQSPDMQAVLDAMWAHLLPAIDVGSGPSSADGSSGPDELVRPVGDGTSREIPEGTYGPGTDNEIEALRTVGIRAEQLVLDDGEELTAAIGGPASWTVGDEPLATAYAWSGDTLLIDVVFLESPHRLQLTLDPAARTFTARWQTTPLGVWAMRSLRMP
ncbi:hypothetical protein GCM10009557_43950 [Virgisporangium ochraceum]|uniref:Beta-lactamase-related domain-containing protein n=1 Tax=Virgisporangium ochraceum TaxID=65505 RepID=A0A8J4A223_9ACTN|nr:serine hydrolase domain-containing protein [Virgisporangium ochraceum]GIJ72728.1 hypothetical protein Voc01_076450 [Virgisporangium ochraceum]